jgi:cytochrome o ubiquinol oxidase operon protein cyoD
MSAAHETHGGHHHQPHVHSHHHGHGEGGAAHGSLKGYMVGFVLSVILTAIPFWLVMDHVLDSNRLTTYVILGFAFVQICVHMVYFLHLNTSSESGWNMLALIFTAVLLVIMLVGSFWVMYHMNANMMPPMSAQDMRNMP